MGYTEDLIVAKEKHLKPKSFLNSSSSYCQIPSAAAQVTMSSFTKAHQLLKDYIDVILMPKRHTIYTNTDMSHDSLEHHLRFVNFTQFSKYERGNVYMSNKKRSVSENWIKEWKNSSLSLFSVLFRVLFQSINQFNYKSSVININIYF